RLLRADHEPGRRRPRHARGPQRQRGRRVLFHTAGRKPTAVNGGGGPLVSGARETRRASRHPPPVPVHRDLRPCRRRPLPRRRSVLSAGVTTPRPVPPLPRRWPRTAVSSVWPTSSILLVPSSSLMAR